MKKILFFCLMIAFQANFAHKADNPYYDFVKKNIVLCIKGFSDAELVQCLNFLSGNTACKGTWSDRLALYVDTLSSQFSDSYNACDAIDLIKKKNKAARLNECGIYTVAALYRIVYKYTKRKNLDTVYLEELEAGNFCQSDRQLLTPDEFEAECFMYIHSV